MEDRDLFNSQLKTCLEEEVKDIRFSAQAREKVRKTILNDPDINSASKMKEGLLLNAWWNRPVALPLKAVSFSFIALLLVAAFYTKTFFYVSKKDIAQYEQEKKITVYYEGVPFGAVQNLAAALDKEKGVKRQ